MKNHKLTTLVKSMILDEFKSFGLT